MKIKLYFTKRQIATLIIGVIVFIIGIVFSLNYEKFYCSSKEKKNEEILVAEGWKGVNSTYKINNYGEINEQTSFSGESALYSYGHTTLKNEYANSENYFLSITLTGDKKIEDDIEAFNKEELEKVEEEFDIDNKFKDHIYDILSDAFKSKEWTGEEKMYSKDNLTVNSHYSQISENSYSYNYCINYTTSTK